MLSGYDLAFPPLGTDVVVVWERAKPPEAAGGDRSCGCRSRLGDAASVGGHHWCHSAVAVVCLALAFNLARKSCMHRKAMRNWEQ